MSGLWHQGRFFVDHLNFYANKPFDSLVYLAVQRKYATPFWHICLAGIFIISALLIATYTTSLNRPCIQKYSSRRGNGNLEPSLDCCAPYYVGLN